jgi:hypothetical protein
VDANDVVESFRSTICGEDSKSGASGLAAQIETVVADGENVCSPSACQRRLAVHLLRLPFR